RFTEDGLALEVLKRLDRLLWLCTVGELNPGKDGMRHAVSRCWRVSGRNAAALLPVGLDEGLVFGIVDRPVVIGADLEIFAHFRIELDQLLGSRGPSHDHRLLRCKAEVIDL